MKTVNFVKNAEHVQINKGHGKGNITLTVNDQVVDLNARHPISVATSLTSAQDAAHSLLGGYFVFEQGDEINKLKEWRDCDYKGFIQTDDFIKQFAENTKLEGRGFGEINVAEYGYGGNFNLTAGFEWSAFQKNLKTTVEILRQICTNGMVGRGPLFEKEVPVINLFDHHLDIAAKQLVDISKRRIATRLEVMSREHSLWQEVNLVKGHIERRLKDDPLNQRLQKLDDILYEHSDLQTYYKKDAIEKGIVKALPTTISRMDLWNIATEMNSHTHELVHSTASSLDRISTSLLFPKHIEGVVAEVTAKTAFGSPEQAFFGA